MSGLCRCGCGLPTPVAKKTRTALGHVKGQPVPWLLGHGMRGAGGFLAYDVTRSGCWIARRRSAHGGGYSSLMVAGRYVLAHRFTYERAYGPIPDGLTIDHLCRNRACINPEHLEAVTLRENILRGTGPSALNAVKTHCKYGHLLDFENTYVPPGRPGERACRKCRSRSSLEAYHRRREENAA